MKIRDDVHFSDFGDVLVIVKALLDALAIGVINFL